MRSTVYYPQAPAIRGHAFLQEFESIGGMKFLLFMAAHVPLALAMRQASIVSTIHALATFGIGLIIGLTTKRYERIVYVLAYIAGAEVLWRMTGADVFWEFGKYSVVVILFCSGIRLGRIKGSLAAVFYFALLLPSMLGVIEQSEGSRLQKDLSFNLSGPLSLAICVFFLSQARLTRSQMHRVFLTLLVPIVGVLAICSYVTMTKHVQWGTESNLAASGGFGPNQVSSMLGFAALLSFIFLLDSYASRAFKFIIFLLMLAFLVQSALTFSRSGLYMAVLSASFAAFYLVRDARTRVKLILTGLVLFLLGGYVLLPKLNVVTSGALEERFENTSLTGRDKLFRSDIEIWEDNFLMGVGPGQSSHYPRLGKYYAAHTEFSRLLAEHGMLGLTAILLMLFIAIQNLRKGTGPRERAISGAFITWTFLYMAVNAMRLVAPSFVFGMASIFLIGDDQDS